jgi:hypothetical protein
MLFVDTPRKVCDKSRLDVLLSELHVSYQFSFSPQVKCRHGNVILILIARIAISLEQKAGHGQQPQYHPGGASFCDASLSQLPQANVTLNDV